MELVNVKIAKVQSSIDWLQWICDHEFEVREVFTETCHQTGI